MLANWLRGLLRLSAALAHLAQALWVARQLPHVDEAGRRQRIHWFATTGLRRLGVQLCIEGEVASGPRLIVANHVSWLDVVAIHATFPEAVFVSKTEVKRWPVIGWLVTVAGTLFIERERTRDSIRVVHEMAAGLRDGRTVAVFPEGTTSSGHDLLPMHGGLLQAAISTGRPIQPIALRFSERGHAVSPCAAYIDDTTLVQSLWRVACARDLCVRVSVLAPRPTASETVDRREMSAQVRADLLRALQR